MATANAIYRYDSRPVLRVSDLLRPVHLSRAVDDYCNLSSEIAGTGSPVIRDHSPRMVRISRLPAYWTPAYGGWPYFPRLVNSPWKKIHQCVLRSCKYHWHYSCSYENLKIRGPIAKYISRPARPEQTILIMCCSHLAINSSVPFNSRANLRKCNLRPR